MSGEMMTELETMTEAVFKAVNDYVERRIGPLIAKVTELETRVALVKNGVDGKDGAKGDKGDPGQSVELLTLHDFTAKLVNDVVWKQMAEIPKAKDGERGEDAVVDYDVIRAEIEKMIPAPIAGQSGSPGEKGEKGVDAVVDYEEIKQVISLLIPTPIPGAKGEKGEDGKNAVVDYELLKTEIKAMIPEPIPGEKGDSGDKGEPGEKGIDGTNVDIPALESKIVTLVQEHVKEAVAEIPKPKDGEQGPPGQPGPCGIDGKSVNLESLGLQIESRVDAQVAKAIAEIPKPKDGEPGPKGEDGRSIHPDSLLPDIQIIVAKAVAEIPKPKDGKDGKDGIDALLAKDGQDGIPGQDGPPGRDALEIEPLSEIDFNRSYARRTYALHRGGLWVCRRSQPGVGSWECVVDGVDMEATGVQLSEDSRTLEFKFLASSGKEIAKTVSFPVMLNRGTWRPGAYKQGDVTTRHGSSWHAMKDTEAEPGLPSSEDDWRLIVKRGDRGKDADGVPKRVNNKVVRLK